MYMYTLMTYNYLSVSVSIRRRYHLLVLTRWEKEQLLSVLESCFEALNCLCMHYLFVQLVPMYYTLTKNEFLYCSVLHTVVSSALELFLTELFTILALSKLSKRFGLILRFGLLFTNNSEGFIAETKLSTTLCRNTSLRLVLLS